MSSSAKPTVPSTYVVPKVWSPPSAEGQPFGGMNRPTAFPRFDRELPKGTHPLQLYSLGTPNGQKVTILLEELNEAQGVEYDAFLIKIMEQDQFSSGFTALNPNQKIPAMYDYSNLDKDGKPLRLFESVSILMYLAEKYNVFLPKDFRKKTECMNWLIWQVGTAPLLGGGFGHFYKYAPTSFEYAIDRYSMETKRIMHVLELHLEGKEYICGDEYTIADMAIMPWIRCVDVGYGAGEFLNVAEYKNVNRWINTLMQREAVKRGLRVNGFASDAVIERHSHNIDPSIALIASDSWLRKVLVDMTRTCLHLSKNMVFFSQDLLHGNKRNSPLAIVWLAATLGSKQSSFKKISKKEIQGVNIPYVCKYLQDDKEDFALRLSSNLMVGIARVYRLQTDLLYTDINHVLVNFKRALFSLQQAPVDLIITEVAPERITLPLKELDRIIGLNDEFVFKVPMAVNRNQQAGRESDRSTTQSNLSSAVHDQTILSHQSEFSVDAPLDFPSSSLQGVSAKSSFSTDSKKKEWSDPLLHLPAVASSQAGGRASGDDFLLGAAEPLNLFDVDQGVFNDDYGDFDFEVRVPLQDVEERRVDISDGQRLLLQSDDMEIDADLDKSFGSNKSDQTIFLQEKTPTKTPKRLAKKRRFNLIDEHISLTDSELHLMRLNAPLLLKENEMAMIKEERRKQSLLHIAECKDYSVRRFPMSLQAFFQENQARFNSWHTLQKRLNLPIVDADKGDYQADDEWQEQQGRGTLSRKRKMMDDFQNDDYGDFDFEARPDLAVEDERDLSLEVGRAASNLAMPWHAPRSDTGTQSSARGSKRGKPIRNLSSTPIRRERASDSSLPFDFESNVGPSSASNQGGILELGGFDESSFEKIVREGSDRTNGGEISDAETKAFYEYILMLAEETDSTSVFLLDICFDQPRKTAAAAFYNVLRCAGEGYVKVQQVDDDVEIVVFPQA